jgi:biotin synthase
MLTKSEIVAWLQERDEKAVGDLYREADEVRKQYVGDAIHLRGLIEFSNHCKRFCEYCGLRHGNQNVVRFRMTLPEILDAAILSRNLGIQTVVLQSGEDSAYSIEDLCSLVRDIKKLDLAITLSIGERSYEDYERLREAGADRFLLRFETSDPSLFARLKPDSSYKQRFQCLESLRRLGYQVGSGIMVGLPGQSIDSIADDILRFKELDLDMIGIGPFIPHPDTPLRGCVGGTIDLVLRTTALTRIVTRDTHIPATTATGTIDATGRQKALRCGANVIMPNMTPAPYRKNYLIYPGKICISETPGKCSLCVEGMATELGRTIGRDAGHSLKIHRLGCAVTPLKVL